ncbi:MAG: hypothetical protein GC182_12290 [Rhodopseudomonas sp.]|nr:hypothetical protein [Rhodopseudomonas sp.]
MQAFLASDPLDFLVIDGPALGPQQLADLAVALAAVLLGQPDQGQPDQRQTQVVLVPGNGLIALRAAGHAEDQGNRFAIEKR